MWFHSDAQVPLLSSGQDFTSFIHHLEPHHSTVHLHVTFSYLDLEYLLPSGVYLHIISWGRLSEGARLDLHPFEGASYQNLGGDSNMTDPIKASRLYSRGHKFWQ